MKESKHYQHHTLSSITITAFAALFWAAQTSTLSSWVFGALTVVSVLETAVNIYFWQQHYKANT